MTDQFFRYLLVGGSAAVIDLGAFMLLVDGGLAVALAAILSFGLAAIWNYTLSARLVFARQASGKHFLVFLAFASLGLAVNASTTWALFALGMPAGLAKIAGIGLAFGFNFLVNAKLVFR
jgi:putative flippase GtrA